MAPTAEYLAALEVARLASQAYVKAQLAYRARKIGDVEFLAARKAHDVARDAFDAAFDKELIAAGTDHA